MKALVYILLLALSSFSLCDKKKIIYLVRHGETNFNTDPVPRVRGRINVPLNDAGIAHCKAAGDFLANENIGKIYYSAIPRAKQSADCIVQQHNGPVELIEEPLVIDISWGIYEGKTYMEAFGDEKGGDLMFHPEKLIVPEGETFYAVMDRLRLFFVKFWEVIISSMVERKSDFLQFLKTRQHNNNLGKLFLSYIIMLSCPCT